MKFLSALLCLLIVAYVLIILLLPTAVLIGPQEPTTMLEKMGNVRIK